MTAVGWTLVAALAALWVIAVCQWGYWQGKAAEWKARAEVRAKTIDRLYEERANHREEWRR